MKFVRFLSVMAGVLSCALPLTGADLFNSHQNHVEDNSVQQASFAVNADCCPSVACCAPWAHRDGFFADLLLLRARDTEVVYAQPVNGTVPEGGLGIVDSEFDFGFRLGFTKQADACSSFVARYSGYFSHTSDAVAVAAPNSLIKGLVHPNALNAAANVPNANADSSIDFHVLDLEYRFLFLASELTAVNFSVGARAGTLEQQLSANYAGGGLFENVATDIDFFGAGIRLAADVERHSCSGFFGYGKTAANFLGGEFEAEYLHSSSVDPVVAASNWEAARLVSILELEVGAGWQNSKGLRFSAGYQVNSWLNTVKTGDWINAVQANTSNYRNLGDALTFDGFVARAEYRY